MVIVAMMAMMTVRRRVVQLAAIAIVRPEGVLGDLMMMLRNGCLYLLLLLLLMMVQLNDAGQVVVGLDFGRKLTLPLVASVLKPDFHLRLS